MSAYATRSRAISSCSTAWATTGFVKSNPRSCGSSFISSAITGGVGPSAGTSEPPSRSGSGTSHSRRAAASADPGPSSAGEGESGDGGTGAEGKSGGGVGLPVPPSVHAASTSASTETTTAERRCALTSVWEGPRPGRRRRSPRPRARPRTTGARSSGATRARTLRSPHRTRASARTPPRTDSPIPGAMASRPPPTRPPRPRVARSPPPCSRKPFVEVGDEVLDRQALLGHRVALAPRHLSVLERVEVNRDAERRADLVLAPVPAADRAGVVEVAHPLRPHEVEHLPRRRG